MKNERLLLRNARSLTFDASSFKMAETLFFSCKMARIHRKPLLEGRDFCKHKQGFSHFKRGRIKNEGLLLRGACP